MADFTGISPLELAKALMMAKQPGQSAPTQGAGQFRMPQGPGFGPGQMKPTFGGGMAGAKQPTVPGKPQIPGKVQDELDYGHDEYQMPPGELENRVKYNNMWDSGNTKYGPVGPATVSALASRGADNDSRNPMRNQLDAVRAAAPTTEDKIRDAMAKQLQGNKPQTSVPSMGGGQTQARPLAEVIPLEYESKARAYTPEEISGAAQRYKASNTGYLGSPKHERVPQELDLIRNFDTYDRTLRNDIRDFHLAKQDPNKWAAKRVDHFLSTPEGRQELRSKFGDKPGIEAKMKYKTELVKKANEEMQALGPEKFYEQLRVNLKEQQSNIDKARQLIDANLGD